MTIDLTADDPDRRVANLGVDAEGVAASDIAVLGGLGDSDGPPDAGVPAAGVGTTAAAVPSRPGHQAAPGSIFASPDQHAATGSLFVGSPGPSSGSTLLPADPLAPVQALTAADRDEFAVDLRANMASAKVARWRRGRNIALVGGLLAIVTAGAGGTFVWSALGGGGPQPESALPSTTVAFVKVDLDPSAGQKVDAVRFLRAFPQARDKVSQESDLREVAFTALQAEGQLTGVDYRADVAPWIGQRIALGLVPGATTQDEPVAVLALAVQDPGAARTHLPKVATALGGTCQVVQDFAVCTRGKDGSALDAVLTATARGSLAEAATFRQDMGDLGEDGIVAGWVDSAKAAELVGSLPLFSGDVLEGLTSATADLPGADGGSPGDGLADTGRTAIALRFDGPHLELAGHTNGAKASFVGKEHVTGVTSLPWNSLAAVSIANGGAQLRAAWPEISRATGSGSAPAQGRASATKGAAAAAPSERPLAAAERLLGISLPEDLYAALGSQLTLVLGGVEERNGQLKAALVGNGDQVVLGKLATSGQAFGGEKLTLLPSPGRSVLATSDEYGQEIVTGSGLGTMPGFQDAVQDVEDARAVVYIDIAGLVSEFKDEMDPKDVADLASLSALGVTVSGEGTSADFRVRLTTK